MEDFAVYILEEENLPQKMLIAYYLSKRTGIFFDKSIVLKAEIAKIFMDYMEIDVDRNLVLTAMLLCNCRKSDNAQRIGKLETFAKEGAEYLQTLGFNKRFCKICEEVNRYSKSLPREKESDILEVIDQFCGLILNRIEREAFTPKEALVILQERNLKYIDNRYMNSFIQFVQEAEKITIRERIDIPIITKIIHLHNREANVKTFIIALANKYSEKIENAVIKSLKNKAKKVLEENTTQVNSKDYAENRMKELIQESKMSKRALFSEDTTQKVLNHETEYRIEE